MLDRFNRSITYLRISVTDRCNLRCVYCMPENGVPLMPHCDILSFEEIRDVVKTGVSFGIRKVRITGGEPLVRKDIIHLVEMISEIRGIEDLSMTTNGMLLSEMAGNLAKAGLHRLNISMDSAIPENFSKITRGGNIEKLFAGIEAAKKAGLNPIKINCVIDENTEEENARSVREFCDQHQLELRYIHRMDLKKGSFSQVEGGDGGDCDRCNRLRLTPEGKLKPCLFDDLEFDIRKLGIEEAYKQAVRNKPACGTFNFINFFNNIGG